MTLQQRLKQYSEDIGEDPLNAELYFARSQNFLARKQYSQAKRDMYAFSFSATKSQNQYRISQEYGIGN